MITAYLTHPDCLLHHMGPEHPENPHRLEAIRALSFFSTPQAREILYESLIYPQDEYLEYTFQETLKTLDRRLGDQN